MRVGDPRQPESIETAVTTIRNGGIVAYPTETVYGLAVDPYNLHALDLLFSAKGRDREKAILLIVADQSQLGTVATSVSPRAQALIDAFWPGPLSILFPKHPDLPEALAPGLDKICVRCPGAEVARQLCAAFGGAITSTSANASGEAPIARLADLHLPHIALGLDGGVLAPSPPSTIVDAETGEVLREGSITRAQISVVLDSLNP